MESKLFDTDVIIDYLKGNRKAIQFFESYKGGFCISAISIAELHSGLKEGEERDLDYFLSLFTIYPVTEEIATRSEAAISRIRTECSKCGFLLDRISNATSVSRKTSGKLPSNMVSDQFFVISCVDTLSLFQSL
jgi:hypothetical protein